MHKSILLLLLSSLLLASAHSSARYVSPPKRSSPYSMARMNKRASSSPSTCSFMQCAVSHGNCGYDGSSLVFCPLGEHCDGASCISDLPLGSTCNPNAHENECAEGTCVDTGNGPVCQVYQQVLPGGSCKKNSECYYSTHADGSSVASTCMPHGICYGKHENEPCLASHQCVMGTFCSSATAKCVVLGELDAQCSSDSECNDRFACISGKCSAFFAQAKGEECKITDHCAPGLFCGADGKCQSVAKENLKLEVPCSVQADSCSNGMECSCNNFTVAGQTATCSPIRGTYKAMPTIQKDAFTCMDMHKCGDDVSNPDNVKCIEDNCKAEYCRYFTRLAPELFSEYPTCLISRMVGNSNYYTLLQGCESYRPSRIEESTGSASSLSLSLAVLFLSAILLAL